MTTTPENIGISPVKTHKIKSKSREGKFHLLHEFEDGRIECTCEGFQYNHKCIHAEELKKKLSTFEGFHNGHSEQDRCQTCYECVRCREGTGYTHGGCADCAGFPF